MQITLGPQPDDFNQLLFILQSSDNTLKILQLWLSKAYLNCRVQTTFLLIKGHFLNLSRYFNLIKSVNFVLLKIVCLNGRHEDCTDE